MKSTSKKNLHWPAKPLARACCQFEDSCVMGIRYANARADGGISLNPPMDTRLAPGDKVIAISADDDTIQLSGLTIHPGGRKA